MKLPTALLACLMLVSSSCSGTRPRVPDAPRPTTESEAGSSEVTAAVARARALLAQAQDSAQTAGAGGVRELLQLAFDTALAPAGAEESPLVEETIWTLGERAMELNQPLLAKQAFEWVRARREHRLSPDHPDTLRAQAALAVALEALGDLAGARDLEQHVIDVLERAQAEENDAVLTTRLNLAKHQQRLRNPQAALVQVQKVLDARERTLPREAIPVQETRVTYALVLRDLGRIQEADEILREALTILEQALPEIRLQSVRSALASTRMLLGDNAGARAQLEKLLEAQERNLPEDSPNLQSTRVNLAGLMQAQGDSRAARAPLEKAVTAWEKIRPDGDPQLLVARNNLGAVLTSLGELEEARELFERVVSANERALPFEHQDVQTSRINLGYVLYELGELAAAREMLATALEILERTRAEDDLALQVVRTNLAATLQTLGDLVQARALQERVLAINERNLPEEHPNLQIARQGLAITLKLQGDFEAARSLEEQALLALERTHPEDAPLLQMARSNLGSTLLHLGDTAGARALFARAIQAYEGSAPPDLPSFQRARVNLADVLAQDGDLRGARELLESALASLERTLGAADPGVQLVRGNLAEVLASAGEAEALSDELEKLAYGMSACQSASLTDTPRESLARLEALAKPIGTLLALVPRGSELERPIFEMLEDARARGVAVPLAVLELPREAETILEESRALEQELQKLLTPGPPRPGAPNAAEANPQRIAEVVRRREDSERRLRRTLEASSALPPSIQVGPLREALPEASAAVTYYRHAHPGLTHADDRASRSAERLTAFVLARDGQLTRVELGPLEPIAAAVHAWRAALGSPLAEPGIDLRGPLGIGGTISVESERSAGEALRRLVLDPVLDACPGARELHVCCDELLALVPLDALPLEAGWVGDRWRICLESSFTRLVAPHGGAAASGASMLILGGVDYDAQPIELLSGAALAALPAELELSGSSSRTPAVAQPASARWTPLPGSAAEVESIAARYRREFGNTVHLLTGAEATKAAFIEKASGARFVHVSTHGWSAPESVAARARGAVAGTARARLSVTETVAALAPMSLCGLALAGANHGMDRHGRAAGLISAEELSSLDLSGCELAVLAACDTGRGLARAGLSIQSQQAALHAAGVQSAITSLWRVEDQDARALFEEFYSRIWTDGEPKAEALWNAKQALRAKNRPTASWAGWVLSGDPR